MLRHGIYPRDIIPPVSDYYDSGRFGRMFGKLVPFASDTPRIRKALMDIGAVNGPMNARENLAADDNVYGAGPGGSPHLYDRSDGDKFLPEENRHARQARRAARQPACGPDRQSARRREPHHLAVAGRFPEVPQCGGGLCPHGNRPDRR